MPLLANILGFSLFGLAARVGQLGIQKRNLFENPTGHIACMAVFGYGGYLAYKYDIRAAEILAERRVQIEESRQRRREAKEAASEAE